MSADSASQRREGPEKAWFLAMAETTSTAIMVVRETFLFANPAAERLLGYPAAELAQLKVVERVHCEHRADVAARVRARLEHGGEPKQHVIKILRRDDEVRWIEYSATDIEVEGERAVLISAFDITERRQAEDALFGEKERAQVTLTSIGDAVIRTDAKGRVDFLNPVAEALTGWSSQDALGKPLATIYRPVDEATGRSLPDDVASCLDGERSSALAGLKRLKAADGTFSIVQDSVAPIRDREGLIQGSVLVLKDVSRVRGLEREMRTLATRDRLTGLLNRAEFERLLELAFDEAQERGTEHVLCYFDLDEFKLVNDVCGHSAGDQMLQQVADLLRRCIRPRDVLARLGGDEFGLLLRECSRREARTLAHRIRREVAEMRFSIGDQRFEAGASIGMVPITDRFESAGELLAAADGACYIAKDRGRSQLHEYRSGDAAFAERYGEMKWVQRIQRALDENRLVLYCQPIESLTGDRSARMHEIFLRMVSSSGEIVAPGAFIQAAESYRLVSTIDRWVVRAALDAMAAAQRSANTSTLCDGVFTINLSGQSLGEEGFLEDVVGALRASGVDPKRLCFEVTETSAIGNLGHALLFFSVLRDLGCCFCLDDFGSGLSSFAYLKNLPVDYLKIDGEFVSNIVGDPVLRAIVESIHHVGGALDIRTIAEGVEDTATLEAVKELGLDFAQGYLLGKPKPLL